MQLLSHNLLSQILYKILHCRICNLGKAKFSFVPFFYTRSILIERLHQIFAVIYSPINQAGTGLNSFWHWSLCVKRVWWCLWCCCCRCRCQWLQQTTLTVVGDVDYYVELFWLMVVHVTLVLPLLLLFFLSLCCCWRRQRCWCWYWCYRYLRYQFWCPSFCCCCHDKCGRSFGGKLRKNCQWSFLFWDLL